MKDLLIKESDITGIFVPELYPGSVSRKYSALTILLVKVGQIKDTKAAKPTTTETEE